MIINTNGFEIGDEVWIPNLFMLPCKPIQLKIKSFLINDYGVHVYVSNHGWDKAIYVDCLYMDKQDCQLACDRLNGISHD